MQLVETAPAWLAEVVQCHGEPSNLKGHGVRGLHRIQRTWQWNGEPHIRVALVTYDDAPMRVVYVECDDTKARLDLDVEPSEAQVRHLLRAVGVLPVGVAA